jgi:hypothetical protein
MNSKHGKFVRLGYSNIWVPERGSFMGWVKRLYHEELGAGFTDEREQALLNDYFRSGNNGSALAIALFTTSPTQDDEAATGAVEVTNAGSYARQSYTRTTGNWDAASGTAPAVTQNTNAVTFPEATGNWGNVKSWGYYTSATYGAGNLEFWAALDTAKDVNSGTVAEFAAGALVAKLGDPGDSY